MAYRSQMEGAVIRIRVTIETIKTAESLLHSYQVYEEGRSRRSSPKTKYVSVQRGDRQSFIDGQHIPSFENVQAERLSGLARDLRIAGEEVTRMTGLIDTWTEQPLTTVEEEIARTAAQKSAARKIKSDERAAKKAVKDAKKATRKAKLDAKLEAATTKARALLDAADANSVRSIREAYVKVLSIKLPAVVWYQEFVEHYLDRKVLLESAGLVRPHNGTWMDSAYEVERLIRESR